MQQKKSRLKLALIISILPAGRLAIKTEACRRVPKRRVFLFSVNALQSCTLSFNNVFASSSNWFHGPWLILIQGPALKVDKVSPEVHPSPDIPVWLWVSEHTLGLGWSCAPQNATGWASSPPLKSTSLSNSAPGALENCLNLLLFNGP